MACATVGRALLRYIAFGGLSSPAGSYLRLLSSRLFGAEQDYEPTPLHEQKQSH